MCNMVGLSVFYCLLIIAAAVLQVLLIVKFWKMCEDIRVLRNHFVPFSNNEIASETASTVSKDLSWIWAVIICGAIILLVIILS